MTACHTTYRCPRRVVKGYPGRCGTHGRPGMSARRSTLQISPTIPSKSCCSVLTFARPTDPMSAGSLHPLELRNDPVGQIPGRGVSACAQALREGQQAEEVVPGGYDAPPPFADPVGADPQEPTERAWTQTTGLHELLQPRREVLGATITDQSARLLLNRHGATPPDRREGGRLEHCQGWARCPGRLPPVAFR